MHAKQSELHQLRGQVSAGACAFTAAAAAAACCCQPALLPGVASAGRDSSCLPLLVGRGAPAPSCCSQLRVAAPTAVPPLSFCGCGGCGLQAELLEVQSQGLLAQASHEKLKRDQMRRRKGQFELVRRAVEGDGMKGCRHMLSMFPGVTEHAAARGGSRAGTRWRTAVCLNHGCRCRACRLRSCFPLTALRAGGVAPLCRGGAGGEGEAQGGLWGGGGAAPDWRLAGSTAPMPCTHAWTTGATTST